MPLETVVGLEVPKEGVLCLWAVKMQERVETPVVMSTNVLSP
jgi:hypothetical protein